MARVARCCSKQKAPRLNKKSLPPAARCWTSALRCKWRGGGAGGIVTGSSPSACRWSGYSGWDTRSSRRCAAAGGQLCLRRLPSPTLPNRSPRRPHR
eukprot:scaffold11716_cov112-Isochrysis_galbana.AAC.1